MITKIRASEYELHTEQWLPRPLTEVFEFFSQAANLEAITPPWMQFHIVDPSVKMRQGIHIEYKLRIKGIPVRWVSEIPVWEPPHRFVDNQVKGPYQRWYHTHTFAEKDGGTLVTDHIAYTVPGGALINRWFVEPDVRKIFTYRREALTRRFGGASDG
ncbi:MAG: ligand-binding SRPBCC domain-containing protein [Kiritimatiellia bacterium]|jgi:ligand-binding SRPBCC domain-containing protein